MHHCTCMHACMHHASLSLWFQTAKLQKRNWNKSRWGYFIVTTINLCILTVAGIQFRASFLVTVYAFFLPSSPNVEIMLDCAEQKCLSFLSMFLTTSTCRFFAFNFRYYRNIRCKFVLKQ